MSTVANSGLSSFFSGKPLRFIAASILLVNGLFPAIWILFTSLKTEAELTVKPITWFPHAPTLANYMQAFSDQPLHLFLFNSFMVALLSTALTILISVLAAYALARLNLKYRALILSLIIAVSTFPLVTLLVPLFEIMRALNLLNSWTALILPYTVLSLPVCTLMLVSFFESIPRDLENAAMIDGCTRIGALFKVVVPLCAPGVFTAGILAFVNAWDEFLLALSFGRLGRCGGEVEEVAFFAIRFARLGARRLARAGQPVGQAVGDAANATEGEPHADTGANAGT